MIITLVITAVIDSVFLCGAIDADAQFLPQFFFRIVFNEADSLVFTICLHEVNVDARVFVLRAYFDLEYSAIWHDKSVCGGLGCFRYRLKRNRDKTGGRTKEKLVFQLYYVTHGQTAAGHRIWAVISVIETIELL